MSSASMLKDKLCNENISDCLDNPPVTKEKKEKHVEKKKATRIAADRSSNPFYIADDMDFFLLKEQEWTKSLADRIQKRIQRVQDKRTYSSEALSKTTSLRRQLQLEDLQDHLEVRAAAQKMQSSHQNSLWKLLMSKEKKTESEDINNYLERNRQMFLLQYALDMKRREIQRMEILVSKEEQELQQAEKSLEQDAALFDEFLRDNDCCSVQALKVAEKETKAKIEKVIEIRDLTAQMLNIKSEMAKFEDMLQQYKVYKDFLYKLSPKDWQEEQKKKQQFLKRIRDQILEGSRGRQKDTRHKIHSRGSVSPMAVALGSQHLEPSLPLLPVDVQGSKKFLSRHRSSISRSTVHSSVFTVATSKPSQVDSKLSTTTMLMLDDNMESDEEVVDLYFTEPKQLLDLFVVLEEKNLSLIQNTQEMQETLEDLEFTLKNTKNRMDKEVKQLKQWMETMMASINKEEEMAADLQLRSRVFHFGQYKGGQEDKLLESLNRKVSSVYKQCMGGQQESNLGAVQMLTVIEHQLNELLENLESMPPNRVAQAEIAKEKERRQRAREEKIRQQKMQQEERLARFQARSQSEIKKKGGRRLVNRSKPPLVKTKQLPLHEKADKEKEEQLFFFT